MRAKMVGSVLSHTDVALNVGAKPSTFSAYITKGNSAGLTRTAFLG